VGEVGALDVLAFLGELVLLAALAVLGLRLGAGGWGVVLAVGLPVLLGVVWGRWLAPRAPRRLGRSGRLVVKPVLALAVAGLLLPVPAWSLALVAVAAVLVAAELAEARRTS
jgi:hypothetical protein